MSGTAPWAGVPVLPGCARAGSPICPANMSQAPRWSVIGVLIAPGLMELHLSDLFRQKHQGRTRKHARCAGYRGSRKLGAGAGLRVVPGAACGGCGPASRPGFGRGPGNGPRSGLFPGCSGCGIGGG